MYKIIVSIFILNLSLYGCSNVNNQISDSSVESAEESENNNEVESQSIVDENEESTMERVVERDEFSDAVEHYKVLTVIGPLTQEQYKEVEFFAEEIEFVYIVGNTDLSLELPQLPNNTSVTLIDSDINISLIEGSSVETLTLMKSNFNSDIAYKIENFNEIPTAFPELYSLYQMAPSSYSDEETTKFLNEMESFEEHEAPKDDGLKHNYRYDGTTKQLSSYNLEDFLSIIDSPTEQDLELITKIAPKIEVLNVYSQNQLELDSQFENLIEYRSIYYQNYFLPNTVQAEKLEKISYLSITQEAVDEGVFLGIVEDIDKYENLISAFVTIEGSETIDDQELQELQQNDKIIIVNN